MTTFLIFLAVFLLGVVIFQISKVNEYVSVLKGDDKANEETDKIAGTMFLVFLVVGMVAMVWSFYKFKPYLLPQSASMHGVWIDSMFNVTLILTGIIFVATQIALFWFAYKYRGRKDGLGYYYPENNKIEMIWTIIPAIVLTGLVVIGLYRWFQITRPEPKGSDIVEITGQQFNWNQRYPGPDGKLGRRKFELIDTLNVLGVDYTDPAALDDYQPNEIHWEVNRPVSLQIGSKDVIHDVGLVHFRLKMDAVPGIPTHLWLVPIITTDSMKLITKDPEFVYELSCDQLCGKGHSAMKDIIVVDTHDQFEKWKANQKSYYETVIKGTCEDPYSDCFKERQKKKEEELKKEEEKNKKEEEK